MKRVVSLAFLLSLLALPAGAQAAGAGRSPHLAPAPARAISPAAFASARSALPAGSAIRQATAASNKLAGGTAVPHLSGETWKAEGRLSGYYLDSVQPNNGHAVYTQYLVSVFASAAQARAAFDRQHAGYDRLARSSPSHYSSAVSHRGFGQADAFGTSLLTVQGRPFYTREEYFVRGRVMAEVVQSLFVADSVPYGHDARTAFFHLAGTLDIAARSLQ